MDSKDLTVQVEDSLCVISADEAVELSRTDCCWFNPFPIWNSENIFTIPENMNDIIVSMFDCRKLDKPVGFVSTTLIMLTTRCVLIKKNYHSYKQIYLLYGFLLFEKFQNSP